MCGKMTQFFGNIHIEHQVKVFYFEINVFWSRGEVLAIKIVIQFVLSFLQSNRCRHLSRMFSPLCHDRIPKKVMKID